MLPGLRARIRLAAGTRSTVGDLDQGGGEERGWGRGVRISPARVAKDEGKGEGERGWRPGPHPDCALSDSQMLLFPDLVGRRSEAR